MKGFRAGVLGFEKVSAFVNAGGPSASLFTAARVNPQPVAVPAAPAVAAAPQVAPEPPAAETPKIEPAKAGDQKNVAPPQYGPLPPLSKVRHSVQFAPGEILQKVRPELRKTYNADSEGRAKFRRYQPLSESQLRENFGEHFDAYRSRIESSFGERDPEKVNQIMNIAFGESSGRANAVGDAGMSHGLFQISSVYNPSYSASKDDPVGSNIDFAGKLYRSGGFKPWLTTARRFGYMP